MDKLKYYESDQIDVIDKKYPNIHIDGRWSKTNPKYITAKKAIDQRRKEIDDLRGQIVKEFNKLRKEIQKYSFISTSMWHYIPPKTK